MEKINLAEILKDCPKGMELDCTMYEDVALINILEGNAYPIKIETPEGQISLNKYGQYSNNKLVKCVIFPKGKTTWEGFQRPFKDGDVVVAEDDESFQLFLLKHLTHSEDDNGYDGYCYFGWDFQCNELFEKGNWGFNRLATEEEKEKLFDAIKTNGYKWNEKTKTLEKLVESHTPKKFYIRIGDIPSEEKSAIYRGDTVVGYEDGVSVYDCVETDGLYHIVMPFPLKEGQGMTYEYMIQEITQCRYKTENPRNVYLVSGMEVGKGHDNEPLIKEVKILKDLTSQFNTKTNNIEETKTLKKLPKFKVGDKVRGKYTKNIYTISRITSTGYELTNGQSFDFFAEYCYELASDKFDINTLKTFESEVLMRSSNTREWVGTIYSHYNNNKFYGCGMCCEQCIPYKGNEHLLGKTDDCDEYFKNWE